MKKEIADNLRELRGRIVEACEEYNRDANDITIVAITKSHPAASIRMAVAAGIRNIGESRVQEAEPKINEVGRIARFHMVGHLQTNKVKKAVQLFDVIQSLDSYRLAEEINRHARDLERVIECYIEVNASGEIHKNGVPPEKTLELIKRVDNLENISLTGLMTVGPLTDDRDEIRRIFKICHKLFKKGRDFVGSKFDTLSMGMTDDFELGVAEGATMIRIGTGIFGPREA